MKFDGVKRFGVQSSAERLAMRLATGSDPGALPVAPRHRSLSDQIGATKRALRRMLRLAEHGSEASLPFEPVVVPPDGREWFTGLLPDEPAQPARDARTTAVPSASSKPKL